MRIGGISFFINRIRVSKVHFHDGDIFLKILWSKIRENSPSGKFRPFDTLILIGNCHKIDAKSATNLTLMVIRVEADGENT